MIHDFSRSAVAAVLDFAVLKPDQTSADIESAASLCSELFIGCLCVRPIDVPHATILLREQRTNVASVVGFPHGTHATVVKAHEARVAIENGARELDMVIALPALLGGEYRTVHDDIAAVVNEARSSNIPVKVILETCYLKKAEIIQACQIAESAGAAFVKTSTGFGSRGATPEVVRTMLDTVDGRIGVKASGGIRSWDDCVRYLRMGCTRIGVGDPKLVLAGGPQSD
ncbi:MAG: deoxyribose-phosphate aldolase [Pirellulales bacterium]|nr:deoxyribose-phosphate aldolase [Pirellulales bacterium]